MGIKGQHKIRSVQELSEKRKYCVKVKNVLFKVTYIKICLLICQINKVVWKSHVKIDNKIKNEWTLTIWKMDCFKIDGTGKRVMLEYVIGVYS